MEINALLFAAANAQNCPPIQYEVFAILAERSDVTARRIYKEFFSAPNCYNALNESYANYLLGN